mmetsp:Transcript_29047/g.69201  ORF Transcript_29047/g.69201 Transcript_29047/m.69201 type:complete len:119 (-) Transcript_29047:166-522(-)
MPRGQWAPRRSLSPQKRRQTECVICDDSIGTVNSPLSSDSAMDFQRRLSYAEIGSSYFCVKLDDEEPEEQECMAVPDLKTLFWTLSGMEFIRLGLGLCACDESSDEEKASVISTNAVR